MNGWMGARGKSSVICIIIIIYMVDKVGSRVCGGGGVYVQGAVSIISVK